MRCTARRQQGACCAGCQRSWVRASQRCLSPAPALQFAIEYSHRAAPELDRMKVIDAIVEKIKTVGRAGSPLRAAGDDLGSRERRETRLHQAHHPGLPPLIGGRCSLPPQPPHKVNLTAPKKVILVTVLKSTCAAAVVEEFKELQKFNIRALTETPEEEEGEEGKEGAEAAAAPALAEEAARAEEAAAAGEGE